MIRQFDYHQPPSARRPLKVYAFDPMLGRRAGGRITIDIPNETTLEKGPVGERIQVIDYDGVSRVLYTPVDLNDEAILMQNGLEPTESDPRFHQQMVYAIAMKVLENFDIALGRKLYFRRQRPLRIFPHAFCGANAFYDHKLRAVLFGYFRADEQDPGPNLPGQTVFTCLSQDIIAHEVTHAVVDRLRPYFIEPTNHDVAAFHEGFSDIVAIFQHFTFPAILRDHIQMTRGDLRSPNSLIELASEFGYATGTGQALRSALDAGSTTEAVPDPTLYRKLTEPHQRGSILVAAVFDAFFQTYQNRIKDLIRIATGGTGKLPDGDLHPDLVNRIAGEAARTAQATLTMCIRAFEYLPPVDVTFGDYLRALVTADYELNQTDESGIRAAMIESFRARGIYPESVTSLAEDSLLWEMPREALPPFPIYEKGAYILREILKNAYDFSTPAKSDSSGETSKVGAEVKAKEEVKADEEEDSQLGNSYEFNLTKDTAQILRKYAKKNWKALHLDPDLLDTLSVDGFHPVFRVNPRGQLLVEMVAQFTQQDKSFKENYSVSGGMPFRGGTTVIAAANGEVRYVIAKPLPSPRIDPDKNRQALARRERQENFVRDCDRFDPHYAWADKSYYENRIARSFNFQSIHDSIKRSPWKQ